jgi:hypothetical protein
MALCAAVGTGLALGSTPVTASAATLYGVQQATFRWSDASGPVTSYRVYVSRDGVQTSGYRTVYDNEAIINSEYGETISIAVAAVSTSSGNLVLGPRSDSSEDVLFLEEPVPGQGPGPLALETPFDFDGDGRSELLVQNLTTGELRTWSMDGNEIVSDDRLVVGPVTPVVAVGDFDGNGLADVLYFLDGASTLKFYLTGNGTGVIPLDPWWHVASSGDYDGDGRTDLLVRNANTSEMAIWLLDGAELMEVVRIFDVDESWLVRTGDIDGDGTDDLVAFGSVGAQTGIILMANGEPKSIDIVGEVGVGWSLANVGDVNADGRDDLVFRTTNATVYIWLMAGFVVLDHGEVEGMGADWENVGLVDLDGDHARDLIWHRAADGRVRARYLDGVAVVSRQAIESLNGGWGFVNPD